MNCIVLLLTLTILGTASAAYDASSVGGCPTAPFTPNRVASKEEAKLKVLVPNITSLRQLVNCSDPAHVHGFCIDVFERALSILAPSSGLSPNISIHYSCFDFPSSNASGPTYNDMIERVADGKFDVVVGDVTIGAHRLSRVDFSHKYMESGVVILTKVSPAWQVSPWIFFGWPFSLRLWCTIVGAFAVTGLLICYLEKDIHPEFTQGHISHRLNNILWFMVEALALLDRESVKNSVARGLMLAWLVFVVLLNASYTAGLSSFLTVNNLSSTTPDLLSLKESGQRIGYRRGSIVKDYLTRRFQFPEDKLVPIRMVPDFISNLTEGPDHGGVAAIVDELPYANIIFSSLASSTCDFTIAGPQLTQEGFGFGFNKRALEAAFSVALMNLTESGCLQELQNTFGISAVNKCSDIAFPSNKVTWKSLFSLFLPLFGSLSLCIVVHYVRIYFWRKKSRQIESPTLVEFGTRYDYPNITQRHAHGHLELQPYPLFF